MNKREQIFKSVFNSAWEKLPPVFQKRYMHRPYSNDIVTVEGKMDIKFSRILSCLIPFFKLFRVLVPYQGKNIPVQVEFRSQIDTDTIYINRKFYFPDNQLYEFNSCIQIIKDNDVVERMFSGMGWRIHYFFDGKKIVMQHKGYVWKVFGFNIPLPLEILIGKAHAEEEMIDDNSYKITMTISHPLFGTMYSYFGNFTFKRLPK